MHECYDASVTAAQKGGALLNVLKSYGLETEENNYSILVYAI